MSGEQERVPAVSVESGALVATVASRPDLGSGRRPGRPRSLSPRSRPRAGEASIAVAVGEVRVDNRRRGLSRDLTETGWQLRSAPAPTTTVGYERGDPIRGCGAAMPRSRPRRGAPVSVWVTAAGRDRGGRGRGRWADGSRSRGRGPAGVGGPRSRRHGWAACRPRSRKAGGRPVAAEAGGLPVTVVGPSIGGVFAPPSATDTGRGGQLAVAATGRQVSIEAATWGGLGRRYCCGSFRGGRGGAKASVAAVGVGKQDLQPTDCWTSVAAAGREAIGRGRDRARLQSWSATDLSLGLRRVLTMHMQRRAHTHNTLTVWLFPIQLPVSGYAFWRHSPCE